MNYLIPKGKNGFFYEPEIKEVLIKYSKLKASLSNEEVLESLTKEIGERIRKIPFDTVAIDEPPMRHLKEFSSDPMLFADGSRIDTMHGCPDVKMGCESE
jgi:hypothetical protein